MAVAEFEGALAGGQHRLGHAENGVTAREVVPWDGTVGLKPDKAAVDLKRTTVKPLGGEVVGVDAQDIRKTRIALKDATRKLSSESD